MDDSFLAILVVIGWVACGLVGQLIARTRGAREGFTISVLLGPLGWLLVALRPDTRTKCSQCFGVVPQFATKCMHCGSQIDTKPTPLPSGRVSRRRRALADAD